MGDASNSNGSSIKIPVKLGLLIAPLAIAAVLAWAWIQEAPAKYEKLNEKVSQHDTEIAVIKVRLKDIKDGVDDIKTMLHKGP